MSDFTDLIYEKEIIILSNLTDPSKYIPCYLFSTFFNLFCFRPVRSN